MPDQPDALALYDSFTASLTPGAAPTSAEAPDALALYDNFTKGLTFDGTLPPELNEARDSRERTGWEKAKHAFGGGLDRANRDRDLFLLALAGTDEETDTMLAEAEKADQERGDPKYQGDNWLSKSALGVLDFVSPMASALPQGLKGGAAGAATGAAVGAAGGSMAGGVGALPGAVGGAATGAPLGFSTGMVMDFYQQSAGLLYRALRKKGVPHDTAIGWAVGAAMPYTAIESAQLERLPGVKQLLEKGGKAGYQALAKEWVKDALVQTGQEVLQDAGVEKLAVAGAQASGGDAEGAKATLKEIPATAAETAKQTIGPALLLGGVGAGMGAPRVMRENKEAALVAELQKLQSAADAAKAPNSKDQAPENNQAPSSKGKPDLMSEAQRLAEAEAERGAALRAMAGKEKLEEEEARKVMEGWSQGVIELDDIADPAVKKKATDQGRANSRERAETGDMFGRAEVVTPEDAALRDQQDEDTAQLRAGLERAGVPLHRAQRLPREQQFMLVHEPDRLGEFEAELAAKQARRETPSPKPQTPSEAVAGQYSEGDRAEMEQARRVAREAGYSEEEIRQYGQANPNKIRDFVLAPERVAAWREEQRVEGNRRQMEEQDRRRAALPTRYQESIGRERPEGGRVTLEDAEALHRRDQDNERKAAQRAERAQARREGQAEARLWEPESAEFQALPEAEKAARLGVLEEEAARASDAEELGDLLKKGRVKLPTLQRLREMGGALKGEWASIMESLTAAQKRAWLKADASGSLDTIRGSLAEQGFDFATEDDLVQAVAEVAAGKKVYANGWRGRDVEGDANETAPRGEWRAESPAADRAERLARRRAAAAPAAKAPNSKNQAPGNNQAPRAEEKPFDAQEYFGFSRAREGERPRAIREEDRAALERLLVKDMGPKFPVRVYATLAEAMKAHPTANADEQTEGFNVRTEAGESAVVIWENLGKTLGKEASWTQEARRVARHEAKGHLNLRKVLGEAYQSWMKGAVSRKLREDIKGLRELAELYAPDLESKPPVATAKDAEGQRRENAEFAAWVKGMSERDTSILGEEIMAQLAERPEADIGLWERIVAAVRQGLRKLGWIADVTENDVRAWLVRQARTNDEARMTNDEGETRRSRLRGGNPDWWPTGWRVVPTGEQFILERPNGSQFGLYGRASTARLALQAAIHRGTVEPARDAQGMPVAPPTADAARPAVVYYNTPQGWKVRSWALQEFGWAFDSEAEARQFAEIQAERYNQQNPSHRASVHYSPVLGNAAFRGEGRPTTASPAPTPSTRTTALPRPGEQGNVRNPAHYQIVEHPDLPKQGRYLALFPSLSGMMATHETVNGTDYDSVRSWYGNFLRIRVSDGSITQEMADQALAQMDAGRPGQGAGSTATPAAPSQNEWEDASRYQFRRAEGNIEIVGPDGQEQYVASSAEEMGAYIRDNMVPTLTRNGTVRESQLFDLVDDLMTRLREFERQPNGATQASAPAGRPTEGQQGDMNDASHYQIAPDPQHPGGFMALYPGNRGMETFRPPAGSTYGAVAFWLHQVATLRENTGLLRSGLANAVYEEMQRQIQALTGNAQAAAASAQRLPDVGERGDVGNPDHYRVEEYEPGQWWAVYPNAATARIMGRYVANNELDEAIRDVRRRIQMKISSGHLSPESVERVEARLQQLAATPSRPTPTAAAPAPARQQPAGDANARQASYLTGDQVRISGNRIEGTLGLSVEIPETARRDTHLAQLRTFLNRSDRPFSGYVAHPDFVDSSRWNVQNPGLPRQVFDRPPPGSSRGFVREETAQRFAAFLNGQQWREGATATAPAGPAPRNRPLPGGSGLAVASDVAIGKAFLEMAESAEAFQLGRKKTESKNMVDVLAAYSTSKLKLTTSATDPAASQWTIKLERPNGQNGQMDVDIRTDDQGEWMHVYAVSAGRTSDDEAGSKVLYQALNTYAHNNGIRIKGDGLTSVNQVRRSVNMLSSLLRHARWEHLVPYNSQEINGWKALRTRDDREILANNIGATVRAIAKMASDREPAISHLSVDFQRDKLVNEENGQDLSGADLSAFVQLYQTFRSDPDGGPVKNVGIGAASLRVVAAYRGLLATLAAGRTPDAAQLRQSAARGTMVGAFYSRRGDQPGAARGANQAAASDGPGAGAGRTGAGALLQDRAQGILEGVELDEPPVEGVDPFEVQGVDLVEEIPGSNTQAPRVSHTFPDGMVLTEKGMQTLHSIRAKHVTPHEVDKFSTHFMGSGEGAQAYGWGLYFLTGAGTEAYYTRTLSGKRQPSFEDIRAYFTPGEIVDGYSAEDKVVAFRGTNLSNWQVDVIRVRLNKETGEYVPFANERVRTHSTMPKAGRLMGRVPSYKREPNVYTVDLLPDHDELLQWDKKIDEQPDKVKKAVENMLKETDNRRPNKDVFDVMRFDSEFLRKAGHDNMGRFYNTMVRELTLRGLRVDEAAERVSKLMASFGVPGIAYLDGSSRDQGQGTYNYVIFDDRLIRILEKNGTPVAEMAETRQSRRAEQDEESSPYGEWSAALMAGPNYVMGFRGGQLDSENQGAFAATEGYGPYIARDPDTAALFGRVQRVKFVKPRKPIIADRLYILEEADEVMEKPKRGDSPWLRFIKKAVAKAGVTNENWGEKLASGELPAALTDLLMDAGHDAVLVNKGDPFTVLLTRPGVWRDVARYSRARGAEGPSSKDQGPRETRKSYRGEFSKLPLSSPESVLLRKAKDMAAEGSDPKQIWKETGWFQGRDQKWRLEIDDTRADIRETKNERRGMQELKYVLHHPALYEAYPDIQDLPVLFEAGRENSAAVMKRGRVEAIKVPTELDDAELFLELLHEVQHYIQAKEGFDFGADPNVVGQERYMNAPGEIEARDVVERNMMTEAQRRANPPEALRDEVRYSRRQPFNRGRELSVVAEVRPNDLMRADMPARVPEVDRRAVAEKMIFPFNGNKAAVNEQLSGLMAAAIRGGTEVVHDLTAGALGDSTTLWMLRDAAKGSGKLDFTPPKGWKHRINEWAPVRKNLWSTLAKGESEAVITAADKHLGAIGRLMAEAKSLGGAMTSLEQGLAGGRYTKEEYDRFKAGLAERHPVAWPAWQARIERDKAKEALRANRNPANLSQEEVEAARQEIEQEATAPAEDPRLTALEEGTRIMRRVQSDLAQGYLNRTAREMLKEGTDLAARAAAFNAGQELAPLAVKPGAESAGWYVAAQIYKGGVDSVELTQRTRRGAAGVFALPALDPVLTQIRPAMGRVARGKNGADRLSAASRANIEMVAKELAGAEVTQGDAWKHLRDLVNSLPHRAKAPEGKAQRGRHLVIIDPPYWAASANYDASLEFTLPALIDLARGTLAPAHAAGIKVRFTNDWSNTLAVELRRAGFQVLRVARGSGDAELVAFNWDAQTGEWVDKATPDAPLPRDHAPSRKELLRQEEEEKKRQQAEEEQPKYSVQEAVEAKRKLQKRLRDLSQAIAEADRTGEPRDRLEEARQAATVELAMLEADTPLSAARLGLSREGRDLRASLEDAHQALKVAREDGDLKAVADAKAKVARAAAALKAYESIKGPLVPDTAPVRTMDQGEQEQVAMVSTASYGEAGSVDRMKSALGRIFYGWRKHPELPAGHPFGVKFTEGWRLLQAAPAEIRLKVQERVSRILGDLADSEAIDPVKTRQMGEARNRIRQRELARTKAEEALRNAIDGKTQAKARAALEKANREAKEKDPADRELVTRLDRELEANPYHLFRKYLLWQDLQFRGLLPDRRGNLLRLPRGVTQATARAERDRLAAVINGHRDRDRIKEAVARHYAEMERETKELEQRGYIIPDDLRNPFYVPHKVLDYWSGRQPKAHFIQNKPWRGYLEELTGSVLDVETDYLQALYSHFYEVEMHNREQDFVTNAILPYDQTEAIRERVQAEEDAQAIAERREPRRITKEEAQRPYHLPPGHTVHVLDERLPLAMVDALDPVALAKVIGHELEPGKPLAKILKEAGADIRLTSEMLKTMLVPGEARKVVIPVALSREIDRMLRAQEESHRPHPVYNAIKGFQDAWKFAKLFAPWTVWRYTYGNVMTDALGKMAVANPRQWNYVGEAFTLLRRMAKGEMPQEVREAIRHGVMDTVTEQEASLVTELMALPEFRAFATPGELKVAKAKELYGKLITNHPKHWEQIARLSRFLQARAELSGTERDSQTYGGAYWREVEAIPESAPGAGDRIARQAAKVARDTFVDYTNIGVNGSWLRNALIPFYSWMEGNYVYHRNLFRNAMDAQALGDAGPWGAWAGVTRASAVASLAVARLVLKLALPYALFALWNHLGDNDEDEMALSEADRRRLHLVLGRDSEGKVRVIYVPDATADMLEWIGGPGAVGAIKDLWDGQPLANVLGDTVAEAGKSAVNKAVGSLSPLLKAPVEMATGQAFYPDVTDMKKIPRHDRWWTLVAGLTDQDVVRGVRAWADEDFYSTRTNWDAFSQWVLQVRRRDPQSWAFYSIRDKAEEWDEQRTGSSGSAGSAEGRHTQVLRNFRRAIYQGDMESAHRFWERLSELGYDDKKLAASIRGQDPLATIPREFREEFQASLTNVEKWQLHEAYKYYAKIAQLKGSEKALFPAKGEPKPDAFQKAVAKPAPDPEKLLREALKSK